MTDNSVFVQENQFVAIVWFFACGILIGIIYDLFLMKRIVFPAGKLKFILIIDDILFTCISSLLTFVCAYNCNCGILRWYHICVVVFGLALFRATVSRIFMKLFAKAVSFIKKIIKKCVKILLFPISVFVKLVAKLSKKCYSVLVRFCMLYYRKKWYFCMLKKDIKLFKEGFYLKDT